jgi:hypothetical protein
VCVQYLALGNAWGQELHLKTRNLYTGPPSTAVRNGGRAQPRARPGRIEAAHRIIQFDHLPGVEDIDALLAQGFNVVAVIPDNAVMVVASGRNAVTPQTAGIRWQGELEDGDKLSPDLVSGDEAIIEFHSDVEADVQESIALAEGVTFTRPPELLPNHVIVSASMDKLRALASHDEVAYIFPADPALSSGDLAGNVMMPCAGMITLAGPIAQYANIVHGWDLDPDHAAHLGYAFGTITSKVPTLTVESEILRAMSAWSAVANVAFEPAALATAARTIVVKFVSGPHGDAYPFDGPGGILAHTFYPVPINPESIAGDVHLDADENWHAGGDIDIYSVVLHEMGHAIGLGHSDKPGDVMYPYYRRGMQLSANDIGAAQTLYGAPAVGSSAPITAAPVSSTTPLTLTLNAVSPPGQAAQTAISGSVTGGVPPLSLQYQTDHGYSGKVTAGNSGTWSAAGVPLATGANTVTVTALDSAQHAASQSEVITRTATAAPSTGTAPVSIVITAPSSAVTTVKGAILSVAGTSSGGTGITQVTWQTSSGTAGTASGTDHWLASNIPLLTGTNTIVIRAFDAKGSTAWAAVVAVRP